MPLSLTLQDKLYDPGALFRDSGIAFDSVREERIPIFVSQDLSFTKSLVIRHYEVGDFITEVQAIESSFGVSPEAMQELSSSVPSEIFGKIRTQIQGDGPFTPLASVISSGRAISMLSMEERLKLSSTLDKLADTGATVWRSRIDEYLQFRSREYQRRQWNERFREGLDRDFYANAAYMTILTVRSKSERNLVGGIGLIRAPFGRLVFRDQLTRKEAYVLEGGFGPAYRLTRQFNPHLSLMSQTDFSAIQLESLFRSKQSNVTSLPRVPMESKGLGLVSRSVPSSAMVEGSLFARIWQDPSFRPTGTVAEIQYGEIVEPVSFAIAKNVNNRAYVRILAHFLAFGLDPQFPLDFNLRHRIYVTYNDIPRLYAPLGFKDSGIKFEFEGKEWSFLSATGEDLLKTFQDFNRSIAEGDQKYWQEVRSTFETLLAQQLAHR